MELARKPHSNPRLVEREDVVIDINKLSAGMYFLQMKTVSGSFTKKFVKE
jgi:hypothetical protein